MTRRLTVLWQWQCASGWGRRAEVIDKRDVPFIDRQPISTLVPSTEFFAERSNGLVRLEQFHLEQLPLLLERFD